MVGMGINVKMKIYLTTEVSKQVGSHPGEKLRQDLERFQVGL